MATIEKCIFKLNSKVKVIDTSIIFVCPFLSEKKVVPKYCVFYAFLSRIRVYSDKKILSTICTYECSLFSISLGVLLFGALHQPRRHLEVNLNHLSFTGS